MFKRTKVIPWDEFFKEPVKDTGFCVLQITPDRKITNDDVDSMVLVLAELYRPWWKRIKRVGKFITLDAQERVQWEVIFEAGKITFQFRVPVKWKDVILARVKTVWPRAAVREVDGGLGQWDPKKCAGGTVELKKHFTLALKTDHRSHAPLWSLVGAVRAFQDKDRAVLQLDLTPTGEWWHKQAEEELNAYRKGKSLEKLRWDIKTGTQYAQRGLLTILTFLEGIVKEVLDALTPGQKKDTEERIEGLLRRILEDKEGSDITSSTRQKTSHKGLQVSIRVLAQAEDRERAELHARAISNSLNDLAGDNEFIYLPAKGRSMKKLITETGQRKTVIRINGDILNVPEVGRLIQLPPAALQDQVKAVEKTTGDCELPKSAMAGGVPLGKVTVGGEKKDVFISTTDHNILCLPHVGLGGMGTGKTNGLGANMALGFLRSGFSAVCIDVADGKLIDTVRDALPESFPDGHIIDIDLGNQEWPIPLNWSEITRNLTGNGNIKTMDARKAANRLSAQLVNFINKISAAETTDRMEAYLTAAGKAVLGNPANGLLEVILTLSSEVYRDRLLESGSIKNPTVYDTLRGLHDMSEGARGQVTGPILDRLNILLNNEAMANCLLQRNKLNSQGNSLIDFRRWLDGDQNGPYFIGIRIPKEELLDVATDRLSTFIIAKVWLSVLSRYDQPEDMRKPCVFVMDEPHQFMSGAALWSDMVREARKWRLKLCWLAHNFRDFKSLSKTMKDSGCQYSIYKTSKETYQDLLEELAPFEMQDLLSIPDRHWAVNKIVMPGTESTPSFLAQMAPPPERILDRSHLRTNCSKMYGSHIDQVEADILERKKVLYERLEKPEIERPKRKKKGA